MLARVERSDQHTLSTHRPQLAPRDAHRTSPHNIHRTMIGKSRAHIGRYRLTGTRGGSATGHVL